jgi:hypothetical protein
MFHIAGIVKRAMSLLQEIFVTVMIIRMRLAYHIITHPFALASAIQRAGRSASSPFHAPAYLSL